MLLCLEVCQTPLRHWLEAYFTKDALFDCCKEPLVCAGAAQGSRQESVVAVDEPTLGRHKKLIVVDDLPHAADSDQRHRLVILLGRWSPLLFACQSCSMTPKMCLS